MVINNLVHIHFDLLSVCVSIAGILLLGVLLYFNNKESATNRAFLAFALATAVWGSSNYLEYRFTTALAILWALRLHLFISVFHAYTFFTLAYIFPRERAALPRWFIRYLTPGTVFVAILTLTPLVFSGIDHVAPAGEVTRATPAPGIIAFMLVAFGLLAAALYVLARKTWRASGLERRQSVSVLVGMTVTAALLVIFNVVLPNVFSNRSFIPVAALFILPFIALTSYAIMRQRLFDLRMATTAVLGFLVTVFTFVNVLYSTDPASIALNVTAFVIVLLGSIRIVRDTVDLVRQRETILAQEQELEQANRQQEGLLHFISHEVKGYLTKNEAAFAAIGGGDFGAVSDELKSISEEALADTRKGVATVVDILDASNLKKGTVAYDKKPYDLIESVATVVHDLQGAAKEKGLELVFKKPVTGQYLFTGDEDKLARHVFRNVIDNSIKYTPSGSVTVDMARTPAVYRVTVIDTGVGITPDDMAHLFTEGGHGKDSIKVNVHSTGYGLYIAKSVVEAHGGKIWAESKGQGKGSRFIIEFPVA